MILALLALALQTIDGRTVDPFEGPAPAHAFVFIHTDCPVSNRYSPELNRLHDRFLRLGIRLWVVYPGREGGVAALAAHHAEFGLRAPALLDPDFRLADLAGVTMTPEAAVFAPGGGLVYRGRIDDRAVKLGLMRPEPRTRDLADVLDRLVRGERVEPFTTQAVGCYVRGT